VHVAGTLATYVNGRLWLGRTHGRRFSAVELSPGGLYLAVGQPGRLTVYSPDMSRLVWSHRVAGTVVAISWRPIGTQIAYIVRTGGHNVLHLIQADGDTDQVVDMAVAPVTPSWRWDSQAFAYVGAGGRVAIRDLIHARTIPVRTPGPCRSEGAASSVAFAPFGRHRGWLAAALPDHVAFATDTATGRSQCFVARPSLVSTFGAGHVAWTAHGDLLMTEYQYIGRFWIARGHVLDGGYVAAPLGVASIAAAPNGEGMLVALSGHRSLTEVLAKLPPLLGHGPLRITGTVEVLPVAPPHNLSAQLLWR